MKPLFTFGAALLMCIFALSSCEHAQEETNEKDTPTRILVVNGVKYQTATTQLTKGSGLNFKATTANDELTIVLVMKDSELDKEYDLNSESNCGTRYLQVLFSNVSVDSYSIATMGPKRLNVMKEWGGSEIRDLELAKAKISKNSDDTYTIYITAEGDGLSFQMDYTGEINQIN